MTKPHTALAAGALTIGAALISRSLRASRAMDFRGCSAVITGGSRGLGLLIARELGRRGARITVAARDEEELARARQDLAERGIDVTTVVCDVANQDDARTLIEGVVARPLGPRPLKAHGAHRAGGARQQRAAPLTAAPDFGKLVNW